MTETLLGTMNNTPYITNTSYGQYQSCKGIPDYNGILDSISGYFIAKGSEVSAKALIYNSSLELIGTSDEDNSSHTTEWVTFPFTTKPSITAGQIYYIGVIWESNGPEFRGNPDDESNNIGGSYRKNMTYSSPDSNIGSWTYSYTTSTKCVYGTYTITTGTSTKKLTFGDGKLETSGTGVLRFSNE